MVRQPLARAEADGNRCGRDDRLDRVCVRRAGAHRHGGHTRAHDAQPRDDCGRDRVNSTAAITFGDAKAAAETLSALRADPHVVTAAILLPDNAMFARFDRDPGHPAEIVLDRAAMKRAEPWQRVPALPYGSLRIGRPIVLGRESIGTIYVESDLEEMRARGGQYLRLLVLPLVCAFGLAFVLSPRLQRIISEPLLRLTTSPARSRGSTATTCASNRPGTTRSAS